MAKSSRRWGRARRLGAAVVACAACLVTVLGLACCGRCWTARPGAVPRGDIAAGTALGGRIGIPAVRRWARKEDLEKEATSVPDFVKSVMNFMSPKPQEPSPMEAAAIRRQQAALDEVQERLQDLRLGVVSGQDDDGKAVRRAAPISVLQAKATQSIAFFAATSEQALTDVLLSMRINAKEFSERNVLVVPVLIEPKSRSLLDFSERMLGAKLMSQGGVALPAPTSEEDRGTWGKIFGDEFAEADSQGQGAQAAAQGLALLVRSDGQIACRGVGRPIWKTVFAELGI
mmetsp:Transcript_99512/g.252843  ORF Transcript_99512/g.252843 Transcript_99512/m.252843 type:complete len:287 (-) Transcript_99512:67-927(-)